MSIVLVPIIFLSVFICFCYFLKTVQPHHSGWTPFHSIYENFTLCTKWFVHQTNATGAFIVHKANAAGAFIVHQGNVVEHFGSYIKQNGVHPRCTWYPQEHHKTYSIFNTMRPRRNEQHFADDIFKRIFFNENVWITIKNSLKFVPKGPINNIPALVQIMAWRRPGDKPLSEPMLVSLPTHICVTRPQWVNPVQSWYYW